MDLMALDRIFRLSRIPVRYINGETNFIVFSRGYSEDNDPIIIDSVLRTHLIEQAHRRTIPSMVREDGGVLYGVYYTQSNHYILAGPVCEFQLNEKGVRFKDYAHRHGIMETDGFTIKIRSADVLSAMLEEIYEASSGKTINENDILLGEVGHQQLTQNLLTEEYLVQNTEDEVFHNSYKEEKALLGSIARGKPEEIRRGLDDYHKLDVVGKLASSPYKHYEYLCAATITLSTRSAIEGGLDAIKAYAMSDLLMQRLEQCTSIPEIIKLIKETRIGFAEKVKEEKDTRAKSSSVQQVKAYIDRHLNESLSLDSLAEVVQMNKTYLSHRFMEEEGIGIQKYIQQHRIELAAEILRLTDNTLIKIANYLCFPTQSYFGAVFKKYYGITPQQYRERERKMDSFDKSQSSQHKKMDK